jgi:protein-S-isoprenylcysteine O-methyltransferase Ste14
MYVFPNYSSSAFSHLTQVAYFGESLIEAACILSALIPSKISAQILSTFTSSSNTSVNNFMPSSVWFLATFIAITGGLFRLEAFRALGRHFTFELAVLKDHKLVTSGPFSVVRHPSYTGFLALAWGSTLAIFARGSWVREFIIGDVLQYGIMSGLPWAPLARALAVAVTALQLLGTGVMLRRTISEDMMLREEFGKQWDEWARRTPYRLVPGVY